MGNVTGSTNTQQASGIDGPTTGARILIVEDNKEIATVVATALRFEGYDVHVEHAGKPGIDRVRSFAPDLLILDVMLPDIDGFAVQRQLIAGENPPPVLFLTARDDSVDVVRGLQLGAEDYVRKPFSIDELIARVQMILRRSEQRHAAAGADDTATMRVADLTLDPLSREVTRGDMQVELTPREFDLLVYLMRNHGIVLTKLQILEAVWQYDFGGDGNIVETYVGYLRRKLDAGERPTLIQTVRGVGYCLRPPKAE